MNDWDDWQAKIWHDDMDSLDFMEVIMEIDEDFDGVDNKLSDGAKKTLVMLVTMYPEKRAEIVEGIGELRREEVEEVLKGAGV